jgi:hypothetical protein
MSCLHRNIVFQDWVYGSVLCKLTPFLQGTSIGVSVLTLLVVSLDRCYIIYRPMRARIFHTSTRLKIVLFFIWVIAMVIASPMVFVNQVRVRGVQGIVYLHTCGEMWAVPSHRNIYNLSIFVLLYTIPLLVMIAAYANIARTLWNSNQQLYSAYK